MALTKINTAGGTLAVEVQGSGPLVVCAPGLGDTRDAYGPLAEQLVARGYTVATMDLRGHGDSTIGFNRYGVEAQAEDFLTVVKELNKGPAVLAGCSLAGGAATIAAAKSAESVAGVVLLGPFLRNQTGAIGTYLMPLLFKWPWGPTVWKMYAPTLWPGLGDKAKARAKRSTDLLTRKGRWSAFYATVCGCDHRVTGPSLGKAKCPALVVMGDKDPDFSMPADEAKWVASNFSYSTTIMVEGAGHAPHFERPAIVGKSVLEFVEKLSARGAFNKRSS